MKACSAVPVELIQLEAEKVERLRTFLTIIILKTKILLSVGLLVFSLLGLYWLNFGSLEVGFLILISCIVIRIVPDYLFHRPLPIHRKDSPMYVSGDKVKFKDGLTRIDDYVFSFCDILKDIKIPNSVTSIGNYAFYGCKVAIVMIEGRITSIGNHAFEKCSNLIYITIPDGIISIGKYAFCDCVNLTSIAIPDSVTEIGKNAFKGCSVLTEINYGGTKKQWDNVSKAFCQDEGADYYTIYYNSK